MFIMAVLFFGLPLLWILTIAFGFIFRSFGFDDQTSMMMSSITIAILLFIVSTKISK